MFILILAQSAATSRAYALKYNDSFDENVDLVGLGVSNLAAGLSGTFVVNGSPTKTEMVDSAGGRSQISQVTTGVIVVVVLIFLTIPLSYMPNAVLAAVVFLIGLKLVDIIGMKSVMRLRPGEFAVALITAATVVIVGVEQGIILAIVLSVIVVLAHVYKPHDRVVSFAADGSRVLGRERPGRGRARAGDLRLRSRAVLREREPLHGRGRRIVEGAQPAIKWFAVDAAAIADIDYSGADALRQITRRSPSAGKTGPVRGRHAGAHAARCVRAHGADRAVIDLPERPRRHRRIPVDERVVAAGRDGLIGAFGRDLWVGR